MTVPFHEILNHAWQSTLVAAAQSFFPIIIVLPLYHDYSLVSYYSYCSSSSSTWSSPASSRSAGCSRSRSCTGWSARTWRPSR